MIIKISKSITKYFILLFCFYFNSAFALLNMELTQGIDAAIPIAVLPFVYEGGWGTTPETNVSDIIRADLEHSGRFRLYDNKRLSVISQNEGNVSYFRKINVDNLVKGRVHYQGNNQYQVDVTLLDTFKKNAAQPILIQRTFTVSEKKLRVLAHRISDLIYEKLIGVRGVFSTRVAYVLVQRHLPQPPIYQLQIADIDGFHPQSLLISHTPIMSPTWSPDGKKVAYVSFEKQRAAIYLEEISTGKRELVAAFPGINGAPAFSPDGSTLAIVLSKSGSPKIYVMDLKTHHLQQITQGFSIDTEPAWMPDGRSLVFTSNRGGTPQIYEVAVATHKVQRLTYEGDYNARAAVTPDGNHLVMLHLADGMFNIAIQDLETGVLQVLTQSSLNESPSVAPNGSMIIFGSQFAGRGVLAMVSSDGRVQLRLPSYDGHVQDPAWSPFL